MIDIFVCMRVVEEDAVSLLLQQEISRACLIAFNGEQIVVILDSAVLERSSSTFGFLVTCDR